MQLITAHNCANIGGGHYGCFLKHIVELGTQIYCLWEVVSLVTFVQKYKSEFRITSRPFEAFRHCRLINQAKFYKVRNDIYRFLGALL